MSPIDLVDGSLAHKLVAERLRLKCSVSLLTDQTIFDIIHCGTCTFCNTQLFTEKAW